MMFKHSGALGSAVAFSLIAAGCGGSSSSGGSGAEITGLAGPDQLSILSAAEGQVAPAQPGGLTPGAGVGDFPESADYFQDEQVRRVWDPAMRGLELVNQILTAAGQTRYADLVNEGPYLALVEPVGDEEGGGNQSAAANATTFDTWTVRSTRASNQSAQIAHVWVPAPADSEEPEGVSVELRVTEAASVERPFGEFVLSFANMLHDGDVEDADGTGVLLTLDGFPGQMGFSFYEERGDLNAVPQPGDYSYRERLAVSMSEDQSSGSVRIVSEERSDWGQGDSGLMSESYLLSYDDNEVLKALEGGQPECFSRNEYSEQAMRYDLYYADGENIGQRVEINGGFNVRTESGAYGHAGYWGLWLPPEAEVANGDTLERVEYGSDETTPYTLVRAPGRLIRMNRFQLDLVDAEGVQFEYWDFVDGANFLVEYVQGAFWKIAEQSQEDGTYVELQQPEQIALQNGQFLSMYSSALGGQVNYVGGQAHMTYFTQTFVGGSDEALANADALELRGYIEVLQSNISEEDAELGQVYLPNAPDINSFYFLEFSKEDLTLYHDVNGDGSSLTAVGLAEGAAPQSGPFTWGMRTGPLVEAGTVITTLADLYDQDEFYVYETGHNPWNRYDALRDANGDDVTFDAPLQFTYTHSQEADRNDSATYDGKKFLVHYGGNGDFWGIPSLSVDLDGDDNPDRYYPAFSIVDGTLLGPQGAEYAIRAREIELNLLSTPGGCAGLDLLDAENLDLPDGSEYVAPDIGPRPEVTTPPAVIGGVLQGT
ncbi:MAG: hypothetical protein GC161_11980 [Planctomycetaceae bacterium]|nr:hypothetical protein [Planctomycetaceae bacterium]